MGIFDQMKQAKDQMKQVMQMRNEAKRLQTEVEQMQATYENGGITVVARGDSSIVSIKISEDTWKEIVNGKTDRFETMLFNVVNGALKTVRKNAADYMAKAMQSGGMSGLAGLGNLLGGK